MNPLVLIVLLTLGGVFAANAAVTNNTSNKSSIHLMNIDSLKLIGTEFEISATISIDNPTASQLTLKKPYLKLFYNDNELGNSLPDEGFTTVKPNARTTISKVNLRIPMTSVPALVMAVFNSKKSDSKIGIEVSTKANGFPVKDRKDFKVADLMKVFKK